MDMCYQEFCIYPPMLRYFGHVLRNEYSLSSSKQIDIYEHVGMFLYIFGAWERLSSGDDDI